MYITEDLLDPQFPVGLVIFTEEIFNNEKLYFLCSVSSACHPQPKQQHNESKYFDKFQPSVAFHIETSHLISNANKMTMEYIYLWNAALG